MDRTPHSGLLAYFARFRVQLGFAVGFVALAFVQPTWRTVAAGSLVAASGELVRIWAAGHLEKGRAVTVSGPYRWSKHPLYAGSSLMGAGFVIASGSVVVALLVAAYLALALTAASRTEEASLGRQFGERYDAYRRGQIVDSGRRFSMARVRRNHEHRALFGMLAILAMLAGRVWWG